MVWKTNKDIVFITTLGAANMIVLHEDKAHYPLAEEVYGDFVRMVVLDENAIGRTDCKANEDQANIHDNYGDEPWECQVVVVSLLLLLI
jgi:hypothetical protein